MPLRQFFLCCSLLSPVAAIAADPGVPGATPNFVVVLGEGQGWTSTSVDMDGPGPGTAAPSGLMPNLERLATEGMRFSSFRVGCPRCTPSRASLLAGISPAQLHMTFGNDGRGGGRGKRADRADADESQGVGTKWIQPEPLRELPATVRTIAEVLKDRGYATAHFGKWHVGRAAPAEHGFDCDDGANTNAGPGDDRTPNPEQCAAITDRGIEFIRAQTAAKKPFFLQLSHYGGGSPEEATPAARDRVARLLREGDNARRGKEASRLALWVDMDDAIGRVLAVLDELDIKGETYVFFTTDHGSPGGQGGIHNGPNAPLSGGKGSVREGGVRVPFLVRGPTVKSGAITAVHAMGWDLAPTIADLAGAAGESFEGGSLVPLLSAPSEGVVKRPRDELVIHFPHYDLDNGGPASAIFSGKYKLIDCYETGRAELFDLEADIGETTDLAEREPEIAAAMKERLVKYLAEVDAQMPVLREAQRTTTDGGKR